MTNSRDMATSVAIGILVIVFVAEMQDDASGFALEARARFTHAFLLDKLAQQAERHDRPWPDNLGYGVDAQRQAIKQIVIIETAEVDIGSHQLMLVQIAQDSLQDCRRR